MHSEVRVKSGDFKLYLSVGLFATIVIVFLAIWFRFEFSIILLSVGGMVTFAGLAGAYERFSTIRHNRQLRRIELARAEVGLRLETAEAAKAELMASIITFPRTERALVLPGNDMKLIEAMTGSNGDIVQPLALSESELDLLAAFTQAGQSYAIIGGQQTGKTYQAQHIAAYWQRIGIRPWVIGPKWDVGEWAGCALIGGGGNFDKVARGIGAVRKLAEDRHADPRPHKSHSIQPVFFDDWTPVVEAVESAKQLILEASTLYASVNILLYFILHSDTADAWGVDRKGAALKDNFIKLVIVPHYDINGLIVRDRTRGYVQFSGEKDTRAARLFSGPAVGGFVDSGPEVVVPDLVIPELTPDEELTAEMLKDGKSRSVIARELFGNAGGNQLRKVDEIIKKLQS